jgi:nucleoside-diphosphate-sugar epimerase
VPFSRKPVAVYSQGMANIAQAMRDQGVRRLVCVSSSATEPHHDPEKGFLFEKVLQPVIVNSIGRTVYADMKRMEALLKDSDLDWTIIRPSGLFETPTVTRYDMAESFVNGTFTSRADLADCMLRQLTDTRYLRKVMAVATRSARPKMFEFFVKEAFQQRPN